MDRGQTMLKQSLGMQQGKQIVASGRRILEHEASRCDGHKTLKHDTPARPGSNFRSHVLMPVRWPHRCHPTLAWHSDSTVPSFLFTSHSRSVSGTLRLEAS